MAARRVGYVLPLVTVLIVHAFASTSAHAAEAGGLPLLRDDVTALQAVVAKLASDLAATKADLASTKADLANAKADLASTKANLAGTIADLAATKTDLASTEADLAASKILLADARTSLDSLSQQVSDQGATLGNNVGQALSSIATANSSITSLFGSVDSVRTSIGELSTAQTTFAQTTFAQTSKGAGDVAFDSQSKQLQQVTQEALLLKLVAGGAPASGQKAQDVLDLLYQAQAQFAAGAGNGLVVDLGLTQNWSSAAQRTAALLDDAQQKVASGEAISLADSLAAQAKEIEAMEQQVNDQRQISLQNFDQKANQLFNILASIIKTMNETRSNIVKNML